MRYIASLGLNKFIMRNSFINNLSFESDRESTKIILALFAGIAAGAVLATVLVSQKKLNLVDRLLGRVPKMRNLDNDASLAHPEKYFDQGEEVVIQAT
jgi:hypothetical protein